MQQKGVNLVFLTDEKPLQRLILVSQGNLQKKIRFQCESSFFRKIFMFFLFLVTKRIVTLYIEVPLMTNLIHIPMMPNEQKKSFQGIAHIFVLVSTLSVRSFY